MYKLPERRGGGGGEVIWAMPERKHSFLNEVFPKVSNLCSGNTFQIHFASSPTLVGALIALALYMVAK